MRGGDAFLRGIAPSHILCSPPHPIKCNYFKIKNFFQPQGKSFSACHQYFFRLGIGNHPAHNLLLEASGKKQAKAQDTYSSQLGITAANQLPPNESHFHSSGSDGAHRAPKRGIFQSLHGELQKYLLCTLHRFMPRTALACPCQSYHGISYLSEYTSENVIFPLMISLSRHHYN